MNGQMGRHALGIRVIGGFLACGLSFFLASIFIDEFQSAPEPEIVRTGRCAAGHPIIFDRPYGAESGFAVTAKVPEWDDVSDTNDSPSRSPLVMCENGKELGPAHSPHADVRSIGRGRYSHWEDYVIFSASDNSDAQRNGREYSAVV